MKDLEKILILGSSGMVGSAVTKYLAESKSFSVIPINAKLKTKKDITEVIKKNAPLNFIINCIGKLKDSKNYEENYKIPNQLEALASKYSFKLIHISTDDVFNSNLGPVNEEQIPNPVGSYGISKLKGETKSSNAISIRTSFLGFDNRKHRGLIEFLLKNNNKKVQGYENQIWSGCTTLQFAKLCEYLIKDANFQKIRKESNVIHFAPLGPIDKYHLLLSISMALNLSTIIEKGVAEEEVTRYLSSLIFDRKFYQRYTTQINKAIVELLEFQKMSYE